MAAFPTMTLTNAGQALQTKVQAGATLTFTRIALGDGQLNGQPISPLTALISQKASVEVDSVRVVGNSTAQASGFFSNADITTGFWWRETGLFAQDPDNGEILYGYTNAGDAGDYIPTVEDTRIEKYIYCSITVTNADSVTITIPASDSFIPETDKGAAGGVAPLDENAKIPEEYLPAVIPENVVTIPDGGSITPPTAAEGGPYEIIMTEDEGDPLPAEDVSFDNEASGLTATTVQGALDELAQGLKDGTITSVTATATAAGWSGDIPVQTITVAGMTATSIAWVGLPETATAQQRDAARKAVMSPTAQGAGTITLTCDGAKPTVDIPIIVYLSGGES